MKVFIWHLGRWTRALIVAETLEQARETSAESELTDALDQHTISSSDPDDIHDVPYVDIIVYD